jgi:hypothetical protein
MFSSSRLLCHRLLWHFPVIQKSFTLLQIMPCGLVDFTPLLYIGRSMKWSLFLLLSRLLLSIPAIPAICYVDIPIFLLLLF